MKSGDLILELTITFYFNKSEKRRAWVREVLLPKIEATGRFHNTGCYYKSGFDMSFRPKRQEHALKYFLYPKSSVEGENFRLNDWPLLEKEMSRSEEFSGVAQFSVRIEVYKLEYAPTAFTIKSVSA